MVTPRPLNQEEEIREGLQPVQGPVAFDATPPVKVPQPMKVAGQSEAASTAENQAVEEPQACRFTWTIENFSRQTNRKIYSDVFLVGGFKWRVLIFPKGNYVDHLSMYLDVADSPSLPYGWSRYAQFSLAVLNQINNRLTVKKDTQHQFHARESDWGFTSFLPLRELYDPGRGFLVNDTCIFEADIVVSLKNQGATCHMNSLPQRNKVDGVRIPQKQAAKTSSANSTVIAPSQTHPVVDDGALNALRTGEGERDISNSRKACNMADLDALEHGPWSINNIPIFLKRWTPGLKLDKVKLPVWVRIYGMPTELWNKEGLSIIASMVGKPLVVDSATEKMCINTSGRAGYARVLVDIDVNGSWVDEVSVSVPFGNGYSLFALRIEYSWKPPKCSICTVFGHVDSNCKIRLNKEEESEIKRRYMAQPHLYTTIKVARDDDLLQQIGKDVYFDLVDHDKVRTFYIQHQTPFNLFKEEVAKEFGIPVQFQRFWIWAKRQNRTYRPSRPLTAQEETLPVGQLREVRYKYNNAELKLFLEIELGGPDLHPIAPPEKSKDDLLLFFKLYDPNKEEIRYVGRFSVKASGKPTEIISKLNQIAGFSPDEEIELYEEIKFEPCVMCERLDKRSSFRSNQIQDGDIICFQKVSEAHQSGKYRYPDVPSFLEYVKKR